MYRPAGGQDEGIQHTPSNLRSRDVPRGDGKQGKCRQRTAHSAMLRKRGADLDLPMASGGRSPTPPRRQLTMPDATPANVFSSIWVLVALALIGAGWVHCSLNREESRLYCAEDVCRFSRDSPDNRRYADATVCVYRRQPEYMEGGGTFLCCNSNGGSGMLVLCTRVLANDMKGSLTSYHDARYFPCVSSSVNGVPSISPRPAAEMLFVHDHGVCHTNLPTLSILVHS